MLLNSITESFMAEVSRDADRRYREKMIRTEKMETFKKQATLAFRRGQFESALTLYDKVSKSKTTIVSLAFFSNGYLNVMKINNI